MEKKQIEVYTFYKKLYPGFVLFFHVKDQYVSLFDDAGSVVKVLGGCCTHNFVAYPDTDMEFLSILGEAGIKVKIVEFRNDKNELDLPDIEILQNEKAADY